MMQQRVVQTDTVTLLCGSSFLTTKQLIFAVSFPVIFNGSFHFLKPRVSEQISRYPVCLIPIEL